MAFMAMHDRGQDNGTRGPTHSSGAYLDMRGFHQEKVYQSVMPTSLREKFRCRYIPLQTADRQEVQRQPGSRVRPAAFLLTGFESKTKCRACSITQERVVLCSTHAA
jgi:hypothetical protein